MGYRLNQTVIRDPGGRIKFRRPPGKKFDLYHIGVWLEADEPTELERVELVEYELHPSFKKRQRHSKNRSNDFSITFWSWGTFRIIAKIYTVGGEAEPIEISHMLDYDLPPDNGSNYVEISAAG